jgi:two-component system phosphate regulon response regulator OmpR
MDFDLLVLDVMMPGEDGFSFTKRLRARGGEVGKTPILMLTARDQTADRIEGLTHGADDYLAKPFEPRELLLRIESILRRTARQAVGSAPAEPGPLRLRARARRADPRRRARSA